MERIFEEGLMNSITANFSHKEKMLNYATRFWFVATAFGLWLFLVYIAFKLLFPGIWVQETNGLKSLWSQPNLAMTLHLIGAAIILAGGPLQLVPQIRKKYPSFHRWIGRSFMLCVTIAMLSGVYILFTEDIGSLFLKGGFVLQTLLVIWFSIQAIRYAMRKDFVSHRRWALRLFIVALSAFFLRIIILTWALATGGIGIDFETGRGWFIDFIAIGQYSTLLLLEWYFRVTDNQREPSYYPLASVMSVLGFVILGGTGLLVMSSWYPEIAGHI